jgi:hypothetical protein
MQEAGFPVRAYRKLEIRSPSERSLLAGVVTYVAVIAKPNPGYTGPAAPFSTNLT